MPLSLVLFEPEIPPNTGNVARLCAAMNTPLHLIEPLGFSLDDKHLKRAGLDYWPHVNVKVWPDLDAFRTANPLGRLVATSARQGTPAHRFAFKPDDMIVLGPETRGLPESFSPTDNARVRIPIADTVRSLNMSTAAGILLFEAMRTTNTLPPAR